MRIDLTRIDLFCWSRKTFSRLIVRMFMRESLFDTLDIGFYVFQHLKDIRQRFIIRKRRKYLVAEISSSYIVSQSKIRFCAFMQCSRIQWNRFYWWDCGFFYHWFGSKRRMLCWGKIIKKLLFMQKQLFEFIEKFEESTRYRYSWSFIAKKVFLQTIDFSDH